MESNPIQHAWEVSVPEAREIQKRLRERLELRVPRDFHPDRIAGADVSMDRGADRGYAGVVVLNAESLETVEEAAAVADLPFPYIPGFLSFRELPPLAAAWEQLEHRPDVVIFDGQGIAHPRRMGIAAHGGLLFGVPSVGCAKSLLIGSHGPLGEERGSTAPIVHRGETVGIALRTRTGVRPVYVSPGHQMDLGTAIELVLAVSPRYREPETTRRSHKLVNRLRREAAGN